MSKKILKTAEILKTVCSLFWYNAQNGVYNLKFLYRYWVLAHRFQQVEDAGFWWRIEKQAVDRMFMLGTIHLLVSKAWRAPR